MNCKPLCMNCTMICIFNTTTIIIGHNVSPYCQTNDACKHVLNSIENKNNPFGGCFYIFLKIDCFTYIDGLNGALKFVK